MDELTKKGYFLQEMYKALKLSVYFLYINPTI